MNEKRGIIPRLLGKMAVFGPCNATWAGLRLTFLSLHFTPIKWDHIYFTILVRGLRYCRESRAKTRNPCHGFLGIIGNSGYLLNLAIRGPGNQPLEFISLQDISVNPMSLSWVSWCLPTY